MEKVFPEIYQKENFEKEQHLNLWQLKNGVKKCVLHTEMGNMWQFLPNRFSSSSLKLSEF